jgi:four helix bundle suffix protein
MRTTNNIVIPFVPIQPQTMGRQIETPEEAFINEGGLRERMLKARLEKRNKNKRYHNCVGHEGRLRG